MLEQFSTFLGLGCIRLKGPFLRAISRLVGCTYKAALLFLVAGMWPAAAASIADLLGDVDDGGQLVLPSAARVAGGTISNRNVVISSSEPNLPATVISLGADDEASLAIFQSRVVLEGLNFEAPSPEGIAIYAQDSDVTLSACSLVGSAGIAIRAFNTRLVIDRCQLEGADVAIGVDGKGKLSVIDSVVAGGRTGVIANGSDMEASIEGSTFEGVSAVAISFDETGNVRIANSRFTATPLAIEAMNMSGELSVEDITVDTRGVPMGPKDPVLVISNAGENVTIRGSSFVSTGAGLYMEGLDRSFGLAVDNTLVHARGNYGVALFGIPIEDRPKQPPSEKQPPSGLIVPDAVLGNVVVFSDASAPAVYGDGVMLELEASVLVTTSAKWPAVALRDTRASYARESVFMTQAKQASSGLKEGRDAVNAYVDASTSAGLALSALLDALNALGQVADSADMSALLSERVVAVREKAKRLLDDGQTSSTIPNGEAPGGVVSYVYAGENGIAREDFAMASRDELARRGRALGMPFASAVAGPGFGTPRLTNDKEDIAAALEMAWGAAAEAADWFAANEGSGDAATRARMNSQLNLALSLIQAFGDRTSAARLLELNAGQGYVGTYILPMAAALTDARFGQIPDGAVYSAFLAATKQGDAEKALELPGILTQFGHVGAAKFLAETYMRRGYNDLPYPAAFDGMAQVQLESGVPLVAPFLDVAMHRMRLGESDLSLGKLPEKPLWGLYPVLIRAVLTEAATGRSIPDRLTLMADSPPENSMKTLALLSEPNKALERIARMNSQNGNLFTSVSTEIERIICDFIPTSLQGVDRAQHIQLRDVAAQIILNFFWG